MSGNVWEWTRSLKKDYPYDPTDGREDLKATGARVVRGGAFGSFEGDVSAAFRSGLVPDCRGDGVGFRVVVSRSF